VDLSGLDAGDFAYDATTDTATLDAAGIDDADGADRPLDGDGDGIGGYDFEGSFYVALPGDADLDGAVDVTDLAILAANWQSDDAQWQDGNFSDDTNVDVTDLAILAANWNSSVQPPAPTTMGVRATIELWDASTDEQNASATTLDQAPPASEPSTSVQAVHAEGRRAIEPVVTASQAGASDESFAAPGSVVAATAYTESVDVLASLDRGSASPVVEESSEAIRTSPAGGLEARSDWADLALDVDAIEAGAIDAPQAVVSAVAVDDVLLGAVDPATRPADGGAGAGVDVLDMVQLESPLDL
jgi:hypothetical protein